MDSIMQHYELTNFDDFSITGFLIPTGHYAQKIGLIDLFKKHLKIKMKTIHHTPAEKIIELFVSMIAGCPEKKLSIIVWCLTSCQQQLGVRNNLLINPRQV